MPLPYRARRFSPHSLPLLGGAAILAASLSAAAAQQEVHQHGVSQLDVALQDNTLLISLQGPAHNFVGFEHAPQTAAERERLDQARTQLRAADALFSLPAPAGCVLQQVETDAGMGDEPGKDGASHGDHDHHDEAHSGHRHAHEGASASAEHHGHKHEHADGHDHDHDHDHDHGHGHVDWRADYTYQCAATQQLTDIAVQVFGHFPQTTEIRYQRVSDAGQSGGVLQPGNDRIGMR